MDDARASYRVTLAASGESTTSIRFPGRHPIAVGEKVYGHLEELVVWLKPVVVMKAEMDVEEFDELVGDVMYAFQTSAPTPEVYVRIGERVVKAWLTLKDVGAWTHRRGKAVGEVELTIDDAGGDPVETWREIGASEQSALNP